MSAKLDKTIVCNKYNSSEDIWCPNDKWHYYTHNVITSYIQRIANKINVESNTLILNAGSGGCTYGINNTTMTHVDIAEEKIKHFPNYILSTIEKMPIEDNFFDLCICVGSVINYCNAIDSINELFRVLKPGGSLILEFEKTKSFELLFTKDFNRCAKIVESFYNGKKEKLWMYSEGFIFDLIKMNNCKIIDINRFHMISPLIYKFTKNENKATSFVKLDRYIKFIPLINKFSSNIILTCVKAI